MKTKEMQSIAKIINLEDHRNPSQSKILNLDNLQKDNENGEKNEQQSEQKEVIDTGKREHCSICEVERRVMKYWNPQQNRYSHYVEPCPHEQANLEKQESFAKEQFEKKNRDLIEKLFPFYNDEFSFGNFKQREGSKDAYLDARDYCINFEKYQKKGIGLIFMGKYGNGKTHLAKSILTELKQKGNTCIFIEFCKLFDRIQSTYSTNENTEDLFRALINTDILVIDDIGVGDWKPDREKILLRIMEDRISKKKPIIFTMNPEGEGNISPRIRSRMKAICLSVQNNGEDYRPEKLFENLED